MTTFQIILCWFISHSAIASVLGDWYVIKDDVLHDGCQLYKGAGHNLFGSICGEPLDHAITTTDTLKTFVVLNLILSTVLFYNTLIVPKMKFFRALTSFVLFVFATIISIIWHTTTKSDTIPHVAHINFFGVGCIFQILVAVFSLIMTISILK